MLSHGECIACGGTNKALTCGATMVSTTCMEGFYLSSGACIACSKGN